MYLILSDPIWVFFSSFCSFFTFWFMRIIGNRRLNRVHCAVLLWLLDPPWKALSVLSRVEYHPMHHHLNWTQGHSTSTWKTQFSRVLSSALVRVWPLRGQRFGSLLCVRSVGLIRILIPPEEWKSGRSISMHWWTIFWLDLIMGRMVLSQGSPPLRFSHGARIDLQREPRAQKGTQTAPTELGVWLAAVQTPLPITSTAVR